MMPSIVFALHRSLCNISSVLTKTFMEDYLSESEYSLGSILLPPCALILDDSVLVQQPPEITPLTIHCQYKSSAKWTNCIPISGMFEILYNLLLLKDLPLVFKFLLCKLGVGFLFFNFLQSEYNQVSAMSEWCIKIQEAMRWEYLPSKDYLS